MKIAIKHEIFIVGDLPITLDLLFAKRSEYIRLYKQEPDILRLGAKAWNTLQSDDQHRGDRNFIIYNTKIEISKDLEPEEWRLGVSVEMVYERPAQDD